MTRLEALALDYHKTIEGEYGCPGLECPGVQRLLVLLQAATASAVLPAAVIVGGVPDADGDITDEELSCPHCHKPGGLNSYYEDIANRRVVVGIQRIGVGVLDGQDTTPYLEISGFYETDGCDDGDNPRLSCDHCGEDCRIPDDLEVEFT